MTTNRNKTRRSLAALAVFTAAVLASCQPMRADWKNLPDAVQHVYEQGVPHTDRNGNPLMKYDPARSFFPISIYHALEAEDAGVTYRLADLKAAGFNCAFAWPGVKSIPMTKAAEAAGIQMIYWNPEPDEVKTIVKSPALFGWCLDDEPIGYLGRGIEQKFEEMKARRDVIRENDKTHPVMLVDAAWIQPPATVWWVKLNTEFDISCHDNYPINGYNQSLSHKQGIPESISLAVASNKESKPLWLVAQNHEWLDPTFNNNFPSAIEQRCMVYTSIIHGATGIVHFSLDSFVTRASRVVGIAPDPRPKYSQGMVATKAQLRQAKEMWEATKDLNAELEELRPALLSPTAKIPYEVAVNDRWKSISPIPVRTLLKTNPNGGYVLLVANIDSSAQNIRIRFPEKTFTVKEYFNAEGSSMFKREADSFDWQSCGYDVRAFQIDLE